MGESEFASALGGELGGWVKGLVWTCVCGATAAEDTEQAASLGLYFHRRSGHQEVTVTVHGSGESQPDV